MIFLTDLKKRSAVVKLVLCKAEYESDILKTHNAIAETVKAGRDGGASLVVSLLMLPYHRNHKDYSGPGA